ncbi:MAG: DUF167 domain-containing protein [Candidatus Hodarchaeota archaeon]
MQDNRDRILINVIVKPSSKVVKIGFDNATKRLHVCLKSHPTKGKANKELLRIIRQFIEKMGFKSVQCTIVRGHTSRTKVLMIENINAMEFQEKVKTFH